MNGHGLQGNGRGKRNTGINLSSAGPCKFFGEHLETTSVDNVDFMTAIYGSDYSGTVRIIGGGELEKRM